MKVQKRDPPSISRKCSAYFKTDVGRSLGVNIAQHYADNRLHETRHAYMKCRDHLWLDHKHYSQLWGGADIRGKGNSCTGANVAMNRSRPQIARHVESLSKYGLLEVTGLRMYHRRQLQLWCVCVFVRGQGGEVTDSAENWHRWMNGNSWRLLKGLHCRRLYTYATIWHSLAFNNELRHYFAAFVWETSAAHKWDPIIKSKTHKT